MEDELRKHINSLAFDEVVRLEDLVKTAYMLQDHNYLNRIVIVSVDPFPLFTKKVPDTVASMLTDPEGTTLGDKLVEWLYL